MTGLDDTWNSDVIQSIKNTTFKMIRPNIAIHRKIRKAKNYWQKRECEQMEKLQTLHEDSNLQKKNKQTAEIYWKKTSLW